MGISTANEFIAIFKANKMNEMRLWIGTWMIATFSLEGDLDARFLSRFAKNRFSCPFPSLVPLWRRQLLHIADGLVWHIRISRSAHLSTGSVSLPPSLRVAYPGIGVRGLIASSCDRNWLQWDCQLPFTAILLIRTEHVRNSSLAFSAAREEDINKW